MEVPNDTRGLFSHSDHAQPKRCTKRIVKCEAAKPEYLRHNYLQPCILSEEQVDAVNYAPTSSLNATKFHRGFSRRHKTDIQPDVSRLERELAMELARERRAEDTVSTTPEMKERITFNILTGEGAGREHEFRQVGKRILNPTGCMETAFAEHTRDASNRTKNTRHRFFELVDSPSEQRVRTLVNEGLVQTQREGSGTLGHRPQRTRSCSAGVGRVNPHRSQIVLG